MLDIKVAPKRDNGERSESLGTHNGYYDIPNGATDMVDLMYYKGMNHSIGEAFCALYRLHDKDTEKRNLEKAKYYIDRELEILSDKEEANDIVRNV